VIFVAKKKVGQQQKISPSSFVSVVGSEFRDPGWIKLGLGILDRHPGSAKLLDYL
jgi:hypothetical protein